MDLLLQLLHAGCQTHIHAGVHTQTHTHTHQLLHVNDFCPWRVCFRPRYTHVRTLSLCRSRHRATNSPPSALHSRSLSIKRSPNRDMGLAANRGGFDWQASAEECTHRDRALCREKADDACQWIPGLLHRWCGRRWRCLQFIFPSDSNFYLKVFVLRRELRPISVRSVASVSCLDLHREIPWNTLELSHCNISPVFSHGFSQFATYSCCSLSVTFGGTSSNDKITVLLLNKKCQKHFTVLLKRRENEPVITPLWLSCSSFFTLPSLPPFSFPPRCPPTLLGSTILCVFHRLLVYLLKHSEAV